MTERGKLFLASYALPLFILVSLSGCLGKPGPVEEYLRVSAGSPGCAPAAPGKPRVAVAVGRFKAAEALDRQAVMMANGRVMSPSLRWYWEASPARLFEQALVGALNCNPGLVAVWPVRSTTESPFSLTGTVTGFEVQQASMRLDASIDMQLWSGDASRLIATRSFSVKVPVSATDAQSIAEAGSKALASLGEEAAGWVESLAGKGAGK